MKYSDVTRVPPPPPLLLLLLMMMMITQLHSSEDVQLPERFQSDDSDLGDMKSFQVALTPPPHALPPDVAQKAAEGDADAAAIREEQAKTKAKLWRKAKEIANKYEELEPATNADQHKVEEDERKKMEHEEEHRLGNRKQQSSTVKRHSAYLLKFG